MHARLLAALQTVAQVQLVARLRDPRLGYPSPKDLQVFLPDIHLISDQRFASGGFRFRNNQEDLLIAVIGALRSLRGQAAGDEDVAVTHLGDILDLWRETAGVDPTRDTPALIANDHAGLINALRHPALEATIFLGNHDYELHLWGSYANCIRKLYLPVGAPQVLVLHGDVFDWLEKLPDSVQNFLVYYFSPDVEPTDYQLGQMYGFVRQTAPDPNDPAQIHCPTPANVGALQDPAAAGLPDYVNVHRAGVPGAPVHEFLGIAYDAVQQANAAHGMNLKTVIIGHTHHARIAVREQNGELFTLIDCGAWIENCSPDGTAANAVPSAQIAALCDNEVRIYQLAPL